MASPTQDALLVRHSSVELAAADWDHAFWNRAQAVRIDRDWRGQRIPNQRHAEVRLLWTDTALCLRFVCQQCEPLVLNPQPCLRSKCLRLPEWDVCEIFLAPDPARPQHYLEYEAAPTGEWLDLTVTHTPQGIVRDFDWESKMTCAAHYSDQRLVIAMRLPFEPMGQVPQSGDCWRANLYRCVGPIPTRGYLAWRPAHTPYPNFHVPACFGRLQFIR